MLFWLAILVGAIVGYLATRIGFYETFIYAFNLCIAAYLAVFLTPYVVTHIPATVEIEMGLPLTLLVLVVGIYLLLHGISFLLFTGQFTIRFPQVVDLPLSALVGFVAGILAVSLLALMLLITPSGWVEALWSRDRLEGQTAVLRSSCDRIHRFVHAAEPAADTAQIFAWLYEAGQRGHGNASSGAEDVNQVSENATLSRPDGSI